MQFSIQRRFSSKVNQCKGSQTDCTNAYYKDIKDSAERFVEVLSRNSPNTDLGKIKIIANGSLPNRGGNDPEVTLGNYDPYSGNIAIQKPQEGTLGKAQRIHITSHELAHKVWSEIQKLGTANEVNAAVNEGMADAVGAAINSVISEQPISFDPRAQSADLTQDSYDPFPFPNTNIYKVHKNGDIAENIFHRVKISSGVSNDEMIELIFGTIVRLRDHDGNGVIEFTDLTATMSEAAQNMSGSVQAAVAQAATASRVRKITFIHSILMQDIFASLVGIIGNETNTLGVSTPVNGGGLIIGCCGGDFGWSSGGYSNW